MTMNRKQKQVQTQIARKIKRTQPVAKVMAKKAKPRPRQPQTINPSQTTTPTEILTLQQTLGNQAVARLIQRKQQVTVTQQTRPGIQRMFEKSKRQRREARSILLNLQNKEWALAKEKTKQQSIEYEKAVFMSGNKWVKGFRGVGGWSGASMNDARKNAKALHSNTKLKGNDRLNKIAEIATNAHQVTNKDHLFGTNWQHSAAMARKIVYYLVGSIPTTQTNLEETLTLENKEEANALKAKIKNTLLKTLAVDETFVELFISEDKLVKDILSGNEEDVSMGRVIFSAQVRKQTDDIQNSQEQQTQPEMVLGFTQGLKFDKEQIKIIEKFNKNPKASLTLEESNYLLKHKKGAKDHRLQEDVSNKLPNKPKAYYDWTRAGWLSNAEYKDSTEKDWKIGFDKATQHLVIRGGKIHFDLSGFRKDDIENIKQSKFYLPYGPTGNSNLGPQVSFKNSHPFGNIGQSELKHGMGITHWELGQIMFNKNLWNRTTFYRYDKKNEKPVKMIKTELNKLGLKFMG